MKTLTILILLFASAAFAAEPQPTLRELELTKAVLDGQMENLQLRANEVARQQAMIAVEMDKLKPPVKTAEKTPEKAAEKTAAKK